MHRRLPTAVIVLALLWAGCSSPINVRYNYNRTIDFSSFRTFDFFPLPPRAKTNPIVFEQIKHEVTRELTERGMQASAENPDVLIAIHTEVTQKVDVANWGYISNPYDATWSRYGSAGVGGVEAYDYAEGSLMLDFVRGNDKVAIWRGIAQAVLPKSIDPATREGIIEDAVEQVMEFFPPPPEE